MATISNKNFDRLRNFNELVDSSVRKLLASHIKKPYRTAYESVPSNSSLLVIHWSLILTQLSSLNTSLYPLSMEYYCIFKSNFGWPMRPLPQNGKHALHHFGSVEVSLTLLIDVFCLDSSSAARQECAPAIPNTMGQSSCCSILICLVKKFIGG